jgi:hypothetical protein
METVKRKLWIVVALLLLLGHGVATWAEPVGTGFTYQGWIADGDQPAEGLYDFQFKLFDANTAGQQMAGTIEVNDVNVVDGHFAVELDFCQPQGQQGRGLLDIFGGEARWLEIGVRPARGDQGPSVQGLAAEPYSILGHRERITVVPYALHALSGGGLYDVLCWPSNWNLGVEETPKTPGDAGGQNLFNVGKLGIGTTSPTCPLDVAGTANLNKDKTGIALTVNGSEALWFNGTYFSWGYGGSANFFGDNVGVGPGSTNPAERLDLSWSGGVNACIGRYNYLGSCFSSATFVLGNNVRARTDSVNGIVVGNQHETYGYRAITMSMDGIQFYGRTGTVKAGDPLDAATERMRITNDGKVGIGTTNPLTVFDVHGGKIRASDGFESIFGTAGDVGMGFIGDNDTGMFHPTGWGTDNTLAFSTAGAERVRIGANGRVGIGTTNPARRLGVTSPDQGQVFLEGTDPNGYGGLVIKNDLGRFGYVGIGGSNWVATFARNSLFLRSPDQGDIVFETLVNTRAIIKASGNVGIGVLDPSEKLEVYGTARLWQIAPGSGTLVVADNTGKLWKLSSSKRYKTNVRDLEDDADKVLGLRPIRFQWTTTGQEDIGLIAEEVDETMKDLVIYDKEGKPDAVKYDRMNLYLIQVVKNLKSENQSLKQRLDLLERRMDKLERDGSRIVPEVR